MSSCMVVCSKCELLKPVDSFNQRSDRGKPEVCQPCRTCRAHAMRKRREERAAPPPPITVIRLRHQVEWHNNLWRQSSE